MRINLLDPGLVAVAGHHLEYDLRIALELASRGHDARVYAHVKVGAEVRALFPASVEVTPIFRVHPYWDWSLIDPVCGELTAFLDGALMLAADLRGVREAEMWMWPTLLAPQLFACTVARPKAALSGCVHVEPTFRAPNGRMWWRYAFLKAREAGLRPNLGVNVPALASEYSPLAGEGEVKCFPIAHDGAPSGACRTALRKIGFFGHQRREKGTGLLPALVPRLLQDGYEVVVQDSGDQVGAMAAPGLTKLDYVPSVADEIAKCDLVVAPYDPVAYRVRGSGIVWDSIASGVPVILPARTEMGSLVESTGAGKLVESLEAEDVYRSILEARRDYATIARAAFEASQAWRGTHGVRRFVSAMLGEAQTA